MSVSVSGLSATAVFDATCVLALGPLVTKKPLLRLREIVATSSHFSFPVLRRKRCSPVDADRILELWNALPEGEGARCHMPGFALELRQAREAIFVAALCWECNNVSVAGREAVIETRLFDATSREAQELLELCRRVSGR